MNTIAKLLFTLNSITVPKVQYEASSKIKETATRYTPNQVDIFATKTHSKIDIAQLYT